MKLKKIAALLLATTTVFTMMAGCSKGETSKEKFILGLDASFPPMGYTENGQTIGFDIDVAKEVCKRLDMELVLQPINWTYKERELNTRNIDCIWNGFTITDERKEKVLFSEPYMSNRQVLVVMEDSDIQTKADLAGKRLALQADSSAKEALEANPDVLEMIKGKAAIEWESNVMALNDLEKGGCDAVLIDEVVAKYYITKKDKGYKILDEELAIEDYGIGFRKEDTELCAKVQGALNDMAADGTLAAISNAWFGEDITTVGK